MPLLPATYTAESVTSGHPDKICDQISDAILDACLAQDPTSRVAVECLGSHGLLVIGGEVTTRADFDAERIARNVYREIGYEDDLEVRVHLTKQSPDIAQGVDPGGAGDQGIMYGYATNETAEYLPRASVEAHRLARTLEQLRKNDATYHWLRPDGKTQITIQHGKITDALISAQHAAGIAQEEIARAFEPLIEPILAEGHSPRFLVNPTGRFVLGGFAADAGLTGRKIMVDTYGGVMPHGGGAFSGKDATKVDRSAAYMCRFVAKNIVANGYAEECLVSVAYAIGKVEPLMVYAVDQDRQPIDKGLLDVFDFRPAAIIERLGLRQAIFQQTAAYGHFGRTGLPWEEVVIC